jgi:hypothetical protein
VSRPVLKPLIWLLAAFGLGALLAPAGDTGDAGLVAARRNEWQLPDLPRKPDLTSQALAMVTSPIFEPEAKTASADVSAEDQRWRVAGIFRRGAERSVLISFMAPGKESQTLHVGQKLPTGHKITQIEENWICVQLGRKSYRLGVEYRD